MIRQSAACVRTIALLVAILVSIKVNADEPKLDLYGDPLPAGAVLRLGTTRLVCEGGFVWMPDGQSLVTAQGSQLRIWNIADGKPGPTYLIPMPGAFRHYLARSADGTKVVCADQNGEPCVWNLKDTQFVFPTEKIGEGEYISDLAMSPDGATFVTLTSGKLKWFSSATCQLQHTEQLAERNSSGDSAVFSPDGKRLAVAVMRSIHLIDPARKSETIILRDAHLGSVHSLAFSSDGKRLVTAGTGKTEQQKLPDGRTVRASRAEIRVWDVAEQRILAELPLNKNLNSSGVIALAPDERTLAAVHRDRLEVWDLVTQAILRTIDGVSFYNPQQAWVAIDPKGKYVAVADNQSAVRVWDLATGQPHLGRERHHHW